MGFRLRQVRKLAVYAQFSVVGVGNAVIDFRTLNLLSWIWPTGDPVRLALYNTLALVLANTNSYLWNTGWTFRRQARRTDPRQKRVGFSAQVLLNIGVNNGLFWLATVLLADTSLPPVARQNIAKVISTVGASALSFLVLRYVVLRPGSK